VKRRPQVVQRFGRASERCLSRSGLGVLKDDDVNFTEIDVVLVVLSGDVNGVPRVGGVGIAASRPEARSWASKGFSAGGEAS